MKSFWIDIYDRIGEAQKAYAMFCGILNNWVITIKLIFTTQQDHFNIFLAIGVGEGGTLEMGRGVPPALSKPDPVVIYLMAQKTPRPNF